MMILSLLMLLLLSKSHHKAVMILSLLMLLRWLSKFRHSKQTNMGRAKRGLYTVVKRSIRNRDGDTETDGLQNNTEITHSASKEPDHPQPKRKRGPTKCLDIHCLPEDLIVPIKCNENDEPICASSVKFQSYLGTIAKNPELCPMNYDNWGDIPPNFKETILAQVETKFAFDISSDAMQNLVLHSVNTKWRCHKHSLKKNFFSRSKSMEENIDNKPPNLPLNQWIHLVTYFNSLKGEQYEKAGKKARESVQANHTTGRTSYPMKLDKLESLGVEVGPLKFFEITHTKKSGQIDEGASNILEILKTKKIQKIGNLDGVEDLDGENIDLEIQVFHEVFDKKRRRFAQVFGSSSTSGTQNSIGNRVLNKKIEELTLENNEKTKQLKVMADQLNRVEEFMRRHSVNELE